MAWPEELTTARHTARTKASSSFTSLCILSGVLCAVEVNSHHPLRVIIEHNHVGGIDIIMHDTSLMDLLDKMHDSFRAFPTVVIYPKFAHSGDVFQDNGVGRKFVQEEWRQHQIPLLRIYILDHALEGGDETTF